MLDGERAMTHVPATWSPPSPTSPACRSWSTARSGRSSRPGLKCVQGKGDRQLDQPQGRRGGVPASRPRLVRRYGAAVVVMAFDEEGQADTVERKVAICQRAYRAADRGGRLRRPRTSSSTRTSSRSPPASRSTTTTRVDFIEATRRIKAQLPRREDVAAASATSRSRSAATTWCARRCTRRSSITRSAPASTWASSTPASSRSTRRSRRTCSSASRTCCSIAGPTRPSGWSSSPRRSRGTRQGAGARTWRWRDGTVEERLAHALVKGIVDFIDADVEEARQKYDRPLADHRRPADGRHEASSATCSAPARCSCRRSSRARA